MSATLKIYMGYSTVVCLIKAVGMRRPPDIRRLKSVGTTVTEYCMGYDTALVGCAYKAVRIRLPLDIRPRKSVGTEYSMGYDTAVVGCVHIRRLD